MIEKFRHYAHIFVSRADETAIVVTLHYNGQGGLLFEDEHPVLIHFPYEAATIGHEVKVALSRTQIRLPVSFAKHKPSEWPAFQISQVKTIRHFEQEFILIRVSGANEANLVYSVEGYPNKDADLRVITSISSGVSAEKFGECITAVYRACRDRRL